MYQGFYMTLLGMWLQGLQSCGSTRKTNLISDDLKCTKKNCKNDMDC